MHPIKSRHLFVALLASLAAAPTFADRGAATLVHACVMPAPGQWQTLSIPLAPSAWRVGKPKGAVPTRAQFDHALAASKVTAFGVRCTGVVDQGTFYPCAVDLSLSADRMVPGARQGSAGWYALNGTTLTHFDPSGVPTVVRATSLPAADVASTVDTVGYQLDRDFLGLFAPDFGPDERPSKAKLLSLRVRVVPNPIAASKVLRSSCLVILGPGPGRTSIPAEQAARGTRV